MQESDSPVPENKESKIPQDETSQQTEMENPSVEKDIDLSSVFPDEDIDLNTLFPDLEMKRFLKKIKRNKKDIKELTRGIGEEAERVDP